METFWQDIQYGSRRLRKNPGFAVETQARDWHPHRAGCPAPQCLVPLQGTNFGVPFYIAGKPVSDPSARPGAAPLALVAGPSAGSLLFGLKPHDPVTLAASVALLTLVAALASFVPARRAAQVDPMVALGYE
jgi:hypothetical protein